MQVGNFTRGAVNIEDLVYAHDVALIAKTKKEL